MKLLWYIEVYIIYNDFNLIYVCDSVYFNTHSMYSYFIYGLLKHQLFPVFQLFLVIYSYLQLFTVI